jgi:hypothetical protein
VTAASLKWTRVRAHWFSAQAEPSQHWISLLKVDAMRHLAKPIDNIIASDSWNARDRPFV